MWEDAKFNVDMLLDEGKPNSLQTYFEARRQTIEEDDSPCRNRDEVTMESLNEQQRFSEHNRSNNKTVTANITGAF